MPILYGQVGSIPTPSLSDSANFPMLQGKAGEMIDTQLHGRGYTGAYRGRTFIASTAAAGVTFPISTTTAPTFTLYNPIGSGVVAELLLLNIGITNTAIVVSPVMLGYISGLLVAPTGLTARTINPALLGGSASAACGFYTVATLAAAASTFVTFGSFAAVTGNQGGLNYDLQGSLVLNPGSLVHICGTAAQTQAMTASLIYAEWPA